MLKAVIILAVIAAAYASDALIPFHPNNYAYNRGSSERYARDSRVSNYGYSGYPFQRGYSGIYGYPGYLRYSDFYGYPSSYGYGSYGNAAYNREAYDRVAYKNDFNNGYQSGFYGYPKLYGGYYPFNYGGFGNFGYGA